MAFECMSCDYKSQLKHQNTAQELDDKQTVVEEDKEGRVYLEEVRKLECNKKMRTQEDAKKKDNARSTQMYGTAAHLIFSLLTKVSCYGSSENMPASPSSL